MALPLQLDVQTRSTLDKFVHSSSTPQSLAQRSRIVLAAADGSNNQQIAAELKIPPITVGKWRRSFAIHGLEGLRDAPRSGRPPKHDFDTRHKVQTRVCQQPEDQSRWSVRTLAAEVGLPASTVHAMLVAANCSRTESGRSPSAPTLILKPSCWILLGCISTRRRMRWCCVWTRKRAFRR